MDASKRIVSDGEGITLLSLVGAHCDVATLQALRRTSLALHDALAPARMSVKGAPALERFALDGCRRRSRLKRDALQHLTLACSCDVPDVMLLFVLARRLRAWAPQLRVLTVELGQKQPQQCQPYFIREAVEALRACAPTLHLRLVDADNDLVRACACCADELTLVAPKRTRQMSADVTLKHIRTMSVEVRTAWPSTFDQVKMPALEAFAMKIEPGFTFKDHYDLAFIPDTVKKLTLPWCWLAMMNGRALLDRCTVLEELVVVCYYDGGIEVSEFAPVIDGSEFRVRFRDDIHAYPVMLIVADDADWRYLAKIQHRLTFEDIDVKVEIEGPPSDIVLTKPRHMTISCCGYGTVPETPVMRRRLLRGLRRAIPNLEFLKLLMTGDQEPFYEDHHPGWQQRLHAMESEELRAAELDLRRGRGAAWPSQEVTVDFEDPAADAALLFPLTPTLVFESPWQLPPTNVALDSPGLHTLAGTAEVVAHAITDGIGGVTCLRLCDILDKKGHSTVEAAERDRANNVADVLAAVDATHGRLQKLQLVRNGRGEAWWEDQVFEVAPGTLVDIV